MTFDRDARQHQVDLVVRVAVTLEILDHAQAGLAVCDGGIHVVLLAVLVDAEAFKVDHAAGGELSVAGAELVFTLVGAVMRRRILDVARPCRRLGLGGSVTYGCTGPGM
jgi:hypothetical protein